MPLFWSEIKFYVRIHVVANWFQDSLKHVNVVVHADPRYPPYSLLCVANFLRKSGFVTKVNNHVHSTLKDPVNKNLAHHFDSSEWDECTESSESLLNFRLTVIWKLGKSCRVNRVSLSTDRNYFHFQLDWILLPAWDLILWKERPIFFVN